MKKIQDETPTQEKRNFLTDKDKLEKLAEILMDCEISIFEYYPAEDRLLIYNKWLELVREISDYQEYVKTDPDLYEEDRWRVADFFQGKLRGPLKIRMMKKDGTLRTMNLSLYPVDGASPKDYLLGSVRDISMERERRAALEEKARRDSLTKLYNHYTGKELINEYLAEKDPYDSCGLMLLDIDYFKNVNDNYGHLFGDEVLLRLSRLLEEIFDEKDILMRAGGDEFVILLKEISHAALLKKSDQLVKNVRRLNFAEVDYSMSVSVGVCFLPENIAGYTYDQLFNNADWALYQAKEKGRNRYVFCDTLRRFELTEREVTGRTDIDARYLNNDIISTAFEIFEKQSSFQAAIELLLEVIGIRLQLDRITVIKTDIKGKKSSRQYQWISPNAPEVLDTPSGFTKEDFLTLFHGYDEYGTVVLQHDHMELYSEEARALLMQGEAKTVVYSAMYCEGQYTGAISYVVCGQKRYWAKSQRSQLGELTKIISAHLARNQALNVQNKSILEYQEFDSLTGLLSFARFREEVERLIVGNYAEEHAMIYTDFCCFKKFNQRYGYGAGDQLLKDFSSFTAGYLLDQSEVYFTRVSADQFIVFMKYGEKEELLRRIEQIDQEFLLQQRERYPDNELQLRTGVYFVTKDTTGSAEAIDMANYARLQVNSLPQGINVCAFDDAIRKKLLEESGIVEGFDQAMIEKQFRVFVQPRFSLKDFSLTGAEAMIRWQKDEHTLLYPGDFLNMYEKNGQVIELDFFVFEQVVAFLEKCQKMGRRQVPVSVNASIRHAQNKDTVQRYKEILEKHQIDPALLEIEFTESDTVSYYTNVKEMLLGLQKIHLATALDDFGKGYSRLNMVIDVPVDTVKLDRNFICVCENTDKGVYFLKQMVEMVKGLGYRVVCEGVETGNQVELLRAAGCDEAQGYWFAHPMPLEEFEKSLYEGDGFAGIAEEKHI